MEKKNKETYWSQFASEFEEKQSRVVGKEILFLMQEELLKESDLRNVLELGCGTGLYTETLQKISTNVVATDFSEEMISFAKLKRGNLKNVEFKQANALNLEFDAESFDSVFMANLIHVIGNAGKLIQESKQALIKGGRLIITSFAINEMNFFSRMRIGIKYLKTFGKPPKEAAQGKTTRRTIEKILVNNGFKISKSILLGNRSKAFYITCIKN